MIKSRRRRCGTNARNDKVHTGFLSEVPKGRGHLDNLGVSGRIILKFVENK
jgi:hypothetical protein